MYFWVLWKIYDLVFLKKYLEAESSYLFSQKSPLETVWYYHLTHAFQSESTIYSCLNVKELLARNKRDIEV